MRIGVFGGSFDPVHYGHLLLAECCREQAQLDRVWFVPAATPPHKRDIVQASGEQRLAMLRLAIAGNPALEVCDGELTRGGVSYTVDTLREIAAKNPGAELFLLLGADSLADLPTWREPEEICRLATPLVVGRPGTAIPDYHRLAAFLPAERIDAIRSFEVLMPLIEISSTDLRQRVAAGRGLRYRTPPEVEAHIAANGLYRASPSGRGPG
jgi:nicotinate-nucleotide adenylyltransferase